MFFDSHRYFFLDLISISHLLSVPLGTLPSNSRGNMGKVTGINHCFDEFLANHDFISELFRRIRIKYPTIFIYWHLYTNLCIYMYLHIDGYWSCWYVVCINHINHCCCHMICWYCYYMHIMIYHIHLIIYWYDILNNFSWI